MDQEGAIDIGYTSVRKGCGICEARSVMLQRGGEPGSLSPAPKHPWFRSESDSIERCSMRAPGCLLELPHRRQRTSGEESGVRRASRRRRANLLPSNPATDPHSHRGGNADQDLPPSRA